jgi:hypothetical protein
MTNRSRIWTALVGATAMVVALLVPASTSTAATPAVPRALSTPLAITATGFVEVRQLFDSTADCENGLKYTQINRFDFTSQRPRTVRLTGLSIPGRATVATSTFSSAAGSADVVSNMADVIVTRACPPDSPDMAPPVCNSANGKVALGLTPTDVNDRRYANAKATYLNIGVQRVGGANDAPDCQGRAASGDAGDLVGPGVKQAEVNSSMGPGLAIGVPTEITAQQLFAAKPGKTFKRWITFSGPCSAVIVKVTASEATPAEQAPTADGDCTMIGRVVLKVTAK